MLAPANPIADLRFHLQRWIDVNGYHSIVAHSPPYDPIVFGSDQELARMLLPLASQCAVTYFVAGRRTWLIQTGSGVCVALGTMIRSDSLDARKARGRKLRELHSRTITAYDRAVLLGIKPESELRHG